MRDLIWAPCLLQMGKERRDLCWVVLQREHPSQRMSGTNWRSSPSVQALQREVEPHARHPQCWSEAGQTSCCSRWLQRKPSNFSNLNEVWLVDTEYNYCLALPPSGNPSFPSDGVFMSKSLTLLHRPVLQKVGERRPGPNAPLTQQFLLQTSFPRTHTSVVLWWQMRS